jgi:hypothetical protein
MTIHTVEILWISTHKNDEAETGWKKLKALHNLYSSPNITIVIKLRCIRCERQHTWQRREMHINWPEILKERDHLEDLDIDETMTLK